MGATYPVSAASIAAGRLKVSHGGSGVGSCRRFGNWNGSETEQEQEGTGTEQIDGRRRRVLVEETTLGGYQVPKVT